MVIIGVGTIGFINAQVARIYDERVIISELMEKKICHANMLNFNDPVKSVMELTSGKGADIVILAVGAEPANKRAFEIVKDKRGKILFFAAGYPEPELKISSNLIHYKKMELFGTYVADIGDFQDSARLLSEKHVDMKPILEESYPLKDIQTAFEEASKLGKYRVTVNL